MIKLIVILLHICIFLIISMWIFLGEQIINMKKDLSNIKSVVDYSNGLIRDYYIWLTDRIDDVNKHLTTEIACLAVKNNEDIKRVKAGFQKWDVFKYKNDEYVIYHIEKCSDNRKLYRCQNNKGDTFGFYDDELTSVELVRSASPWLEEEKGR